MLSHGLVQCGHSMVEVYAVWWCLPLGLLFAQAVAVCMDAVDPVQTLWLGGVTFIKIVMCLFVSDHLIEDSSEVLLYALPPFHTDCLCV